MTINSHSSGSALGPRYSPVEQRLSVLNALPHPGLPHPSHASLPSPRNEPIAGPSGLPPVQQVPLVSFHIFNMFLFLCFDIQKLIIITNDNTRKVT